MEHSLYGPADNGDYYTPYQTTVIYDPSSIFEMTIAALTDRVQLVNLHDYAQSGTIEHPTPELLLFGVWARTDIMKLIERGFQLIHCFTHDGKHNYYDIDECGNFVPFNQKVAPFSLDTMYDHLALISGMAPVYLLEHITSGCFADYVSALSKEITHETGMQLIHGLCFGKLPDVEMLKLCAQRNNFTQFDDFIVRGRTILEMENHYARSQLLTGIQIKTRGFNVFVVPCEQFLLRMLNNLDHCAMVKDCDFVVFYSMLKTHKWSLTIVARGEHFVGEILDSRLTDKFTNITIDKNSGTAHGLLAHIY
jgi:hypothetical protein